jgi:O-Antigen ligase
MNRLSHYLFILNLYFSFLFIRFPDIISMPILRFGIYFSFFFGFFFGLISCFSQYRKLTISLIIFICSIIIHAFANFYQPSLKLGISIQNYILQGNITSDFEMTQTRLYIMFFVFFLFPSISFFSSLFNSNKFDKYTKTIFFSLLFCFILNCLTTIYQGYWDLRFLTQGSGTSVEANRAPGLLDNSGVASNFFAIMGSILISLIFNKKVNTKYKCIIFGLFIVNLFSGIMNNSRSFYIGIFGSILILFLFKVSDYVQNKRYKLLFSFVLLSSFIILIINFISKYKEISGLTRLQSVFHAIRIDASFFSRYSLIDEQRSAHLQIMWETIKEHFYTGTGIGSFASNFYYQLSILKFGSLINLDIPTNTYFSIISELGIVGLFLILFCLFLFIFYIIKEKNNTVFSNNIYNLTIARVIPIWGGIPFLILALVSYMFYIPSISYIACLILAPCLVTFLKSKKSNEKIVSLFLLVLSAYLIVVAVHLALTAPPVPFFQWNKRGTPQIPMPIGTLPQPQGQTEKEKLYFSNLLNQIFGTNGALFKPEGASEGQWFKPKTDLLIFQPKYRIYVGSDKRDFPIKIAITFYAKNGASQYSNFIVHRASWVYFSIPKQKEFESCFHDVSSSAFCYYHVSVSPSWEPSFLKSIGFYIENKYIN